MSVGRRDRINHLRTRLAHKCITVPIRPTKAANAVSRSRKSARDEERTKAALALPNSEGRQRRKGNPSYLEDFRECLYYTYPRELFGSRKFRPLSELSEEDSEKKSVRQESRTCR